MQCPKCGLENPQSAQRCDCGYDFQSRLVLSSYAAASSPRKPREEGRKNMAAGAVVCIIGILVTAVTYSAARDGQSYIIAWGAIVFGAVRFFRGLSQF